MTFMPLLRQGALITSAVLVTAAAAHAQSVSSVTSGRQAPLSGSVRAGEASSEPLSLSLDDAVARGVKWNLGVLLSRETVRAARGQREQGVSALLPRLSLTTASISSSSMSEPRKAFVFPDCHRSSGHSRISTAGKQQLQSA